MKIKSFMPIITLLSACVLYAGILNPFEFMNTGSLSKINSVNSNKSAIEAYQDGIGIKIIGEVGSNDQVNYSPYNKIVMKFGAAAKKNGLTLEEYIASKQSDPDVKRYLSWKSSLVSKSGGTSTETHLTFHIYGYVYSNGVTITELTLYDKKGNPIVYEADSGFTCDPGQFCSNSYASWTTGVNSTRNYWTADNIIDGDVSYYDNRSGLYSSMLFYKFGPDASITWSITANSPIDHAEIWIGGPEKRNAKEMKIMNSKGEVLFSYTGSTSDTTTKKYSFQVH